MSWQRRKTSTWSRSVRTAIRGIINGLMEAWSNNFILYSKVPLLIVQDLPAKEEPSMEDNGPRERMEH